MAPRLDPAALARALEQAGLTAASGLVENEITGAVRPAATPEQLQLQALGEANIEVTPLGLLNAYRRLALVRAKAPASLAPLFEGLEAATAHGTAQLAQPAGLKVTGKTGTSAGGHAWFAGWAPAQAPRIVLVVFLEQGRGGGGAAPVARAIFEAYARGERGARRITVRAQGRTLTLPLETYVAAVLAGECATFTSEEALKAMAVTVRTWAFHYLGRHRGEGYDFCDTTHCQYFRLEGGAQRLRAAAEATEGEMLWYEGRPAATFHHAHCGGATEAVSDVWPGVRLPYLRSLTDTFCTANGRAPWTMQVPKSDLATALGIRGPMTLDVVRRTPTGRAAEVRWAGRIWPAPQFDAAVGKALSRRVVRSNHYDVSDAGDSVVIRGHGAGHGVGLCQAGAAERGRRGHSCRQILEFYFPGTVLGLSARGFAWVRLGGERVEVWSTHPQQDGALVELADRALEEAERRAGFALSVRPRIRAYPTVAAFRDATGEPGSVAASTLGHAIRLQPHALLGDRLRSTLLHEMLHVVLEQRAHPTLPPWFREGLVKFLAEGADARLSALIQRHGRQAVMGWLESGLPR
jgi:stage II sporulation protein D